MQNEIIEWFEKLPPQIKELAERINDFILTYELNIQFKYKTPFYYGKSWICYLVIDKKGNNLNLNFVRANELDFDGILDFKGRKMVGSMDYKVGEDIDFETLSKILEGAVALDKNVPYTSPSKRKK